MSTNPKNKGGRPPRAPGEKLTRVNLSLRPRLLFGLELIARDRETSLSQAAEFAIAGMLRNYDVDGTSAFQIAALATLTEEHKIDVSTVAAMHGKTEAELSELAEVMERFFRETNLWRIAMTPSRLRTKEEKFTLDLANRFGVISQFTMTRPDLPAEAQVKKARDRTKGAVGLGMEFFRNFPAIVKEGFRTALSLDEVTEQLKPYAPKAAKAYNL